MATSWKSLENETIACRKCPRLLEHCEQIALKKRKAYQDWDYWGRPVPNFGSSKARLLIVGLAPGAHGANRTGRMFTGDRSGEWLYSALHKEGFATQSESTHFDDGLKLIDCAITAVCHCAPPENKPTTEEISNCLPWLEQTIEILPVRVFLALGQIAWKAIIDYARSQQWLTGPRPKFTHGAEIKITDGQVLLGSYHPSQQNTFTGRLTEEMFASVFRRSRELLSQ